MSHSLLNEPRPFWVQRSDTDAASDLGTDQNARYGSRELLFDPSFELILSPEGQSGEVANVTKEHKDDFVMDAALNFKRDEAVLAWKEESFTWKGT